MQIFIHREDLQGCFPWRHQNDNFAKTASVLAGALIWFFKIRSKRANWYATCIWTSCVLNMKRVQKEPKSIPELKTERVPKHYDRQIWSIKEREKLVRLVWELSQSDRAEAYDTATPMRVREAVEAVLLGEFNLDDTTYIGSISFSQVSISEQYKMLRCQGVNNVLSYIRSHNKNFNYWWNWSAETSTDQSRHHQLNPIRWNHRGGK